MADIEKIIKRMENCVKRITKDTGSLEKIISDLLNEVEERGKLIDILARQVESEDK